MGPSSPTPTAAIMPPATPSGLPGSRASDVAGGERSYELFSLISFTVPKTHQGRTFVRWDFFSVDADGPTLQLLVIIGSKAGHPPRAFVVSCVHFTGVGN